MLRHRNSNLHDKTTIFLNWRAGFLIWCAHSRWLDEAKQTDKEKVQDVQRRPGVPNGSRLGPDVSQRTRGESGVTDNTFRTYFDHFWLLQSMWRENMYLAAWHPARALKEQTNARDWFSLIVSRVYPNLVAPGVDILTILLVFCAVSYQILEIQWNMAVWCMCHPARAFLKHADTNNFFNLMFPRLCANLCTLDVNLRMLYLRFGCSLLRSVGTPI